MSTKRLIAILAVVALVVAAILIVRMTTATSTQVSSATVITANLDPAPAGEIVLAGAEANDFFERHSVLQPGNLPDYPDYIKRHPGLSGSNPAFVSESFATDWFLRHPELAGR